MYEKGGLHHESTKESCSFFGGCSTEYAVSLQSAYAVIKCIDTKKYVPILIGIAPHSGKWYWYQGELEKIKEDHWQSEENCTPVFPSFDRTVHGVLDLMGIPVIGCGLLSSALCMDKELAHRIVQMNGIKAARSFIVKTNDSKEMVQKKALELGYPLFVKHVRSGSSFGISKVIHEQDLLLAVENAFEHDSTVILEEMVDGFEVGCAVLGNKDSDLIVGEVDEIELSDGFFDYTEKYTLKTSSIHVPARISPQKAKEIKETALEIYKALSCCCFARVDMFLTPAGEIYFNEVNTIPGFTEHSRYPNMLKEAGLPFAEVIGRLIEMGISE